MISSDIVSVFFTGAVFVLGLLFLCVYTYLRVSIHACVREYAYVCVSLSWILYYCVYDFLCDCYIMFQWCWMCLIISYMICIWCVYEIYVTYIVRVSLCIQSSNYLNEEFARTTQRVPGCVESGMDRLKTNVFRRHEFKNVKC